MSGKTALTYSLFEDALLLAIVEASDYGAAGGNRKGQVEVFEAAEHAGLERKENWISDAVTSFENQGFLFNVVRPLGHPLRTIVMVTAEGRKHAEFLHSRRRTRAERCPASAAPAERRSHRHRPPRSTGMRAKVTTRSSVCRRT